MYFILPPPFLDFVAFLMIYKYATRVQKERIPDADVYDAVKDYYRITPEVMKLV